MIVVSVDEVALYLKTSLIAVTVIGHILRDIIKIRHSLLLDVIRVFLLVHLIVVVVVKLLFILLFKRIESDLFLI